MTLLRRFLALLAYALAHPSEQPGRVPASFHYFGDPDKDAS